MPNIDHTGYLPRLVKEGFQGAIYCTPATGDLLTLLLPDSGHLQERDAYFANKKKYSCHDPALPLYTEQEARQFLEHLQPVAYHEPKALTDELNFEYLHAGHILGSAMIRLNYTHNGGQKILFFPGDLGRSGQPVIKDPETVEGADYLLLESTYGGRTHQQVDVQAYLEELVQQTVREGGSLIILVFAGGRVLHHLKSRLSDRRNTVLFVGFQPQGSLGRLISEGKEEVKSMGSGCP